ncbi:hypothetical protein [Ramlibacter sp. 2FC]|uniref:T1SS-143 repeat domain-containing protein n=1 Tax=Ramlibacter sp. 2FC TaxID=2502188 RepID=UPI0010FA1E60|nr:hypothetical protein [Ramlibacter sp. 2FC]
MSTLIIDETSGLQNQSTGETANNDIGTASDATGLTTLLNLVPEFDAVLASELATIGSAGVQVALSGATSASSTGTNVFTFSAGVLDVGFTLVGGNGVNSGLETLDGTDIFLYVSTFDNNVLVGRKGGPTGDVVFAAYLDTQTVAVGDAGATGAKVWLVQYEPLKHPVAGETAAAYDDAVSPLDVIRVTVSLLTQFSLEGAPSGQNLFLMYGQAGDGIASNGTGDDAVALVVTAKNAASGGTVNTGQGGGGTTIGSNNQMIDPGEGMVFTFVTDAKSDFTVPNLSQTEADVEGNIQFVGVKSSDTASFKVVQTQPSSKSCTVTITAFTTDAEPGAGQFISGYGDDTLVPITSVVVTDANGDPVSGVTISITGGVATLVGVKSGYTIEYTAVGHNRVQIDNTGTANTKTGADFDIGDFSIPLPATQTLNFEALVFEDDGPALAAAVVTSEVDEDGLPGGNPGGTGDLNAADNINDDGAPEHTTSGNISGLFLGGADGLASFGLSSDPLDIAGLPQGLTSKGDAVTYAVVGNKLTASAGGREVFTLEITNTVSGAYLFTLKDQLDHPVVSTEDDIQLQLGAILQATDGDGDKATATADQFVITVDDDSPDPLNPGDITVHNAAGASASAALGYIGNVGADEEGTVKFVGGADGDILKGILQDGTPALEDLLFGGLPIRVYGFGTDTLTATTNIADPAATVFVMTLNPDGSVVANDLYDITMLKTIANSQDVDFGSFTAHVASGNPLTLVVNDIGGTTVDALFSGWVDTGDNVTTTPPSSSAQTTVNVSQAGVGVGTGQDFNFEPQTASATDDLTDRIRIEFLEDDGDGVLEAGEAFTVNRFTLVMNQNNSPADDGDALVRVYDASGAELQITGILINGNVLVGPGGAPVASNDGGTVTAVSSGLGYELHGLGGGTAGSSADNDTVTIITASGYTRIDISGIGNDNNKDTFDILLKSIAVPVSYDINFSVQAQLTDEDGDSSAAASLDVTLDADGVFVTTVGTSSLIDAAL